MRSLRDLNASHLPLLHNIRSKCRQVRTRKTPTSISGPCAWVRRRGLSRQRM